jgi:hypothetical protein
MADDDAVVDFNHDFFDQEANDLLPIENAEVFC